MSGLKATQVDPIELFRAGLPFDGPVDVEYFEDIPNESTARMALTFLSNQRNEIELRERHVPEDVERMWRAALRGCLKFGVPIPDSLKGYAARIGVVIP